MSEEVQTEAPAPKPKQFLLMADEMTMIFLQKLLPSLLYVQVEGMNIQGNDHHQLLVNPISKPPVTQAIEGVKAE